MGEVSRFRLYGRGFLYVVVVFSLLSFFSDFLLMTKKEYDELVDTLINLTIDEVRDAVHQYSDEEYDI